MTGLGVLRAKEAANEPEWAEVPDGARPRRLRAVCWARRAESKRSSEPFLDMAVTSRPDRLRIGRRPDQPGNGFTFQPSLRREQVDSLHELDFVRRKENVIFLGLRGWEDPPGDQPGDPGRPARPEGLLRRAAGSHICPLFGFH